MPQEIERKFLVRRELWSPPDGGTLYRQGYLSSDPCRTVRVRIAADRAYLTVKGATRGISRPEFEYPIPTADAVQLLDLCPPPWVEKTRYRVRVGAHTWEVDDFHGENEGLLLAEVELASPGDELELPPWVEREVSGDPRYYNASLARNPYRNWR